MKRLVAGAGMLVMLAGPAVAQSSGIYLRADVGAAFGTWSTETDLSLTAVNASLGTDRISGKTGAGVIFDIGAGYRFAPFLRFEGTVGYIPSIGFNGNFNSNPSVTARSNISALVGLATAYLDFAGLFGPLPGNIQPFVLGGAGVANVNNGAEDDYVNGVYLNTFSGTTMTNVAWTAGAGIGIPVTPNIMVDVTYRYLDLGERRVGPTLTAFGGQASLSQDRADLQVHTVMIGLRFAM
jgi:opacity protein-like surface antigen